jgi:heat shock protein HslJ
MKKNLIYLVILSSIGCSAPKLVTTENETSQQTTSNNTLEGTWVLKNLLEGDAMHAPCGFGNEGKVKEMNLTFTAEKGAAGDKKKLHGQSSVNNFMGSYTILSYDKKTRTGKIQFEPLVSTKMAAIDQTFMECESRYFSYLQKSEDFKIEDGKLQLIKTHSLPKGDSTNNSPWGDSYKNVLYFERK